MKYYRLKNEIETVTILYELDRLYQIVLEKNDEIPVGSIVHGRVKKIDKKARLTFVDIGEKEDAFCAEKTGLKAGDDTFFNIRKTPDEEKFYTVDMDLKLEKNSSLLRIIPKKSGEFETKFEKSSIGSSLKDEKRSGIETKENSCYAKTNKNLFDKNLKDERILLEKWKEIFSMKNTLPIPKIVCKAPTKSEKIIEEQNAELSSDKDEVVVLLKNGKQNFERRVDLEKGYLYVDTLPYMTIVDVNSGDYSEFFDSVLNRMEVNKDAMKKLSEIIKLRNLEGVIIMDILKLPGKMNREFLEYLKSEYTEINFLDITKLGMLEMTIKKTGGEKITAEKISSLIGTLENI